MKTKAILTLAAALICGTAYASPSTVPTEMQTMFGEDCARALGGMSNCGVLTEYERLPSKTQGGQDSLECTYNTGLETIKRSFWYSEAGQMGRSVCPRYIDLSQ